MKLKVSYTADELAELGILKLGCEDDEQIPITELSEEELCNVDNYYNNIMLDSMELRKAGIIIPVYDEKFNHKKVRVCISELDKEELSKWWEYNK